MTTAPHTKTTRVICLYWDAGNSDRQGELDTAIAQNAANPDVDEVVLIADLGCHYCNTLPDDTKIKVEHSAHIRPTFLEIFGIANSLLTSPHDRTVLLNTDCWFEPGDLAKLDGKDTRQIVLAVTRRDVDANLSPTSNYDPWFNGRDAWIFTGRIRPMKWLEFRPGCAKCDWYLDWQIQHAGYALANPYHDLRLWHLHTSKVRNWGPSVRPSDSLCVGFTRDLPPTRLDQIAVPDETVTGILAYSLFGGGDMYIHGALVNAEMSRFIYPGFIARFYVDDTVSDAVIRRLRELRSEVVIMPHGDALFGMMWRLKALEDPSVDYVCIRDADSRLSTREKALFDAWVADGSTDYHIVRDHPWHTNSVILSCFDSRKPITIPAFDDMGGRYNCDERFMADRVLPLLGNSIAVHDADGSGPRLPGIVLPSPPRSDHWNLYVGAKVWPDAGIDHSTLHPLLTIPTLQDVAAVAATEPFELVWMCHGLPPPHSEMFRLHNPEVTQHVHHAEVTPDAWKNCDRNIRDWWRANHLDVRTAHICFVECDVMINCRVTLPPGGIAGMAGCNARLPAVDPGWYWWAASAPVLELRGYHTLRAMSPLSVLVAHRLALDVISAPEHDEIFADDCFCEARLPTVASSLGIDVITMPGLDNVRYDVVQVDLRTPSIWHPVKA